MAGNPKNSPVSNLRRLWEIKRVEMNITQVEAAKRLDWTQGAFSQNLNNITELSPQTIIKLANFFGVDPSEIDPKISDSLPNIKQLEVRFNFEDSSTRLKHITAPYSSKAPQFAVAVTSANAIFPKGSLITVTDVADFYSPRASSNPLIYLLRVKGQKEFLMAYEADLPPKKDILATYLVMAVAVY